MFKKVIAMILCLALTAISAGCGDSKDSSSSSSSKAESSATEVSTDADIHTADDSQGENQSENNDDTSAENQTKSDKQAASPNNADSSGDVPPSISSEELTEILLDGKWKSGYITDAQGMIYTITDYCEAAVADPKTFEMQMEFSDDGIVKLKSDADGEETGKYTVDGANVTLIDDADGSELSFIYDTDNKMLFMDILGTGQILIGFTIEK